MQSVNTDDNTIPTFISELLHKIAKKEGFIEYTWTVKTNTNRGDGFFSSMIRTVITGRTSDNSDAQLALLCKMPPAGEARRKEFFNNIIFPREIKVYDELLPALVKFQKDRGVVEKSNGFYGFAKCYGTVCDIPNDKFVIVMDDLNAKNYKMVDKLKKLDFNHAKLVVQILGKLHALSFAVRDQDPKLFKEFTTISNMFPKLFANEVSLKLYDNAFRMAIDTLNEDETELRNKMKRVHEQHQELIEAVTAPFASESFGVVNHGDSWSNNHLYLYGEDDDTVPKDIHLIDWQFVQFGSPALDLTYFLFVSTEKELRDQHYDDLIELYYDTLVKSLNRLGSDPKKLFTFNDLQEQLNRFALFGIITAPILIQVQTVAPDNIPNLDKLSKDGVRLTQLVDSNNTIYTRRMSNAIRDFFKRYDIMY